MTASTETSSSSVPARESAAVPNPGGVVRGLVRIALGWIFLWAFLDKLLGLGRGTPSSRAWINGGHPTNGYLKSVSGPESENPLRGLFDVLAGQGWVDWLFMLGLLGIGTALLLGIALRITAVCAVVLLGFLWMSVLPLEDNPVVDQHVVYALVIVWLAAVNAGDTLGLGRWWSRLPLVRSTPVLR